MTIFSNSRVIWHLILFCRFQFFMAKCGEMSNYPYYVLKRNWQSIPTLVRPWVAWGGFVLNFEVSIDQILFKRKYIYFISRRNEISCWNLVYIYIYLESSSGKFQHTWKTVKKKWRKKNWSSSDFFLQNYDEYRFEDFHVFLLTFKFITRFFSKVFMAHNSCYDLLWTKLLQILYKNDWYITPLTVTKTNGCFSSLYSHKRRHASTHRIVCLR